MKYARIAVLLLCSLFIASKAEARCYPQHYWVYSTRHTVNEWRCPLRVRGHWHVATHRFGKHLAARHWRYTHVRVRHPKTGYKVVITHETLSRPCQDAASKGGPCGCRTACKLLGICGFAHVVRGKNLWWAPDWFEYPRAIPVNGTAAVYKNRHHVAPVKEANKDGTVTLDDYWGQHRVSLADVVIVDPHPPIRAGWRADEAWPI